MTLEVRPAQQRRPSGAFYVAPERNKKKGTQQFMAYCDITAQNETEGAFLCNFNTFIVAMMAD